MNKNLIITIVVVAIIALAAGGYFFMNRSNGSPAITSEDNSDEPRESSLTTQKTSLKNFMSMSGNQQCRFDDVETGNSGEVYIAGGKMRGDFSSKINGEVSASHMINDGTNVYIWMDNQQTGFKTTLSDIEKMSEMSGQTGVSQTVDINKQVDYSCRDWSIEAEKFEVPTDKTFSDMGEMMQDAMKMMPSGSPAASAGNAQACAACDSLEGEQKEQCKSVLKCNN